MLNYNIQDRKGKVTLQHFDLFWRGTLSGGKRREEMCLCWREKSLLPSFFCSCSHCLLFPISLCPVAWQADGSDYTVIISHERKPWERQRDDREREGRERERLQRTHGAAHVSIGARGSAPVLISITLTAQTYIEPPRKKPGVSSLPKICSSCLTNVGSLIMVWLDLIQLADVFNFEV